LHYVLHRGLEGKEIFYENRDKMTLLELIKQKATQLRVKVLAYCITDNEYRLVIENTSGKMSDFLKNLNGDYGMYYRRRFGGKGIVFYDRYQSTLIQDESYLKLAIAYALLTPVRENIVEQIDEYIWSSVSEYFNKKGSEIVDSEYIKQLFGSRTKFLRYHQSQAGMEFPRYRCQYGYILGERLFQHEAIKKYKENIVPGSPTGVKADPSFFESPDIVIRRFEQEKGIDLDDVDIHTYKGKRLRGELLIHLKEKAGLTYPMISKVPLFHNLKASSLGRLYQEAKKRLRKRLESQ
jgi:REP element-mobilizing transposase RayT